MTPNNDPDWIRRMADAEDGCDIGVGSSLPPGVVRFWVPGLPRPGGSKKGFYIPKLNRVVITEDNKKSKDWKATVAQVASECVREPMLGPLSVRFDFCMPRPKGHYGAKGVRNSAPKYPAVKPDATKLVRSTEDALTGIAWRDDAQIVTQVATKRYAEPIGAWITVEIDQAMADGEDYL